MFLTFWLMYFAIFFLVVGTILICFSRTRWYIIINAISPMLHDLERPRCRAIFEKIGLSK
jgi:hypothetical protein